MNEYILYYIRCIRRSKFELRIDINAMAMFIYLTSMIRCYHRKRAKTMIYRTEGGTIALWKFTGGGRAPPPAPPPPLGSGIGWRSQKNFVQGTLNMQKYFFKYAIDIFKKNSFLCPTMGVADPNYTLFITVEVS